MTRLRASLARSPLDREIATKMNDAERAVLEALRLCLASKGSDPGLRRRVLATSRDLQRILGALNSVRRVEPLYDRNDPDLSESRPVVKKVAPPPAPTPQTVTEEG